MRGRPGFRPRFFMEGEPPREGARERAAWAESQASLSPEDSHHARNVLRLRQNDLCEVVTPSGVAYLAAITDITDPVRVSFVTRLEGVDAGAVYQTEVGLVQALARPSLMDFAIEKATEVGAGFFLVVCAAGSAHSTSEVTEDRLVRWRRIAREAAKQSRQMRLPPVELAGSVGEALTCMMESGSAPIVLDPGADEELCHVVRAVIETGPPGKLPPIALWVGPEGGWTKAELELFAAGGVSTARLGRSVLRTETAGPVAVAVTRLALGDW